MGWLLALAILAVLVWAAKRSQTPPDHLADHGRVAPPPHKDGATARPKAEIELAASQFSLACPVNPTRTSLVSMPDSSTDRTIVSVDLQAQTCTCSRFALRARNERDHFSRWCRHLIKALDEDGAFRQASEWHQAMAVHGFEGPIGAVLVRRTTAPDVVIAKGDSDEWVNVYTRTQKSGERIAEASGPIARYGWSLAERRWSWGEAPPGARELRRMLKVVVGIDVRDP